MSHNFVGAPPAELQPRFKIDFEMRTTIGRPMWQPLMVKDPVGLVIFGNSSALYLGQVANPGAGVYSNLSIVKAQTYIHGWSVNAGWLFVLDGVELSGWNIRTGKKDTSLKLVTTANETTANNALKDLQKKTQQVEWATLLEQAEDEWVRLIAEQNAASPFSDERDKLDTVASNYFRMLKSLREITGCTGGAKSARERAAALRKELADEREKARDWCFSRPVIRAGSIEQTLLSVFTIQGNGTLHACDKLLKESETRKLVTKAELNVALLELPKIKLLGYIGDGKLRVVDTTSLTEKSTWTAPVTSPTQSLTVANKQFWWATDAGVYALAAADDGTLRQTLQSGKPFSGRQVGRIKQPTVSYSGINPNDLFDTMNIHAWIASRATQTDPLTAGMLSQLMLSDASGKYTSPAEGSSYLIHGPFERDAQSAASSWTHMKAHPDKPLVLLSDSRGGSVLCRYPATGSGSQLVPMWFVAPWLYSVTPYSALDITLRKDWPAAPTARAFAKPHADMVAKVPSTVMNYLAVFKMTLGHPIGDRDLRVLLWYALHNRSFTSEQSLVMYGQLNDFSTKALPELFTSQQLDDLRKRFSGLGTSWELVGTNFYNDLKNPIPPVNSEPPWVLKSQPALYHSRPPLWIDPWGYNNPGDFVTTQPTATYFDPFCFDGNLRLPQRAVTLDASFKGRRWATFTDNDPASLLASGKPALAPTLRADDTPDPSALVLTVDENRQRATFQVLAPKLLRTTFEAATHTTKSEAPESSGWIPQNVVAPPLVYKDSAETFPTAWCVTNPEFPGVRLRALAEIPASGTTSPWDTFLTTHRTQYGPATTSSKIWKIDLCPLPEIALPFVSLNAYGLTVS